MEQTQRAGHWVGSRVRQTGPDLGSYPPAHLCDLEEATSPPWDSVSSMGPVTLITPTCLVVLRNREKHQAGGTLLSISPKNHPSNACWLPGTVEALHTDLIQTIEGLLSLSPLQK